MTVACAALKALKWQNKATFKLNSYATQMIEYFETLERGRQGLSNVKKII